MGPISSLQQPDVKNVWKAVHPLQNGTSASSYLVPTAKVREEEDPPSTHIHSIAHYKWVYCRHDVIFWRAVSYLLLRVMLTFAEPLHLCIAMSARTLWSAGAHARARAGASVSRLERGLQAPEDRQSAGERADAL